MSQRGATLVEVLITMVILLVGLLGLVALQARLQVAQIDTYQRAQAALLLSDMAQRIASNRINAQLYVTTPKGEATAIGTGTASCDALTRTNERVQNDLREWCKLLQGASEYTVDSKLGGLLGGRGCVEPITAGREYRISVAWQGLSSVPDLGASNTLGSQCGIGAYDGGTACSAGTCRRVITTAVRIANLL